MPSNVVVYLSLLGGYAFIHLFYYTRFRSQRLDGYRLLMESGVVGILLYAAGRLLQPYTPYSRDRLSRAFNNNGELVDTVYVVGLGLVLPIVMNAIIALGMRGRNLPPPPTTEPSIAEAWSELMEPARRAALDWAIAKLGNDLLLLLHEAATRPLDGQMPIHVTADNNKVYIGWVARSPNLKLEDEYLSMLPLASGYRDKDTLEMHLNVFYPIEQYTDRGGQLDPRDFTFVIPYSSIKKAHFFDAAVYVNHFITSAGADKA